MKSDITTTMAGQLIMLLIILPAGLVCLGRALWYAALCLFGDASWEAVGRSIFTYQFGAVICAVFVLGYWNYQSESRGKSILLSLLGVLFLVNLNIAFAVPLVQRMETRLPLLWRGIETQGLVVRVYMRETENRDFLFHTQNTRQYWEPRAEYEFTANDGTSYRGETSCLRADDMHRGQIIPVRYLPENPQINRISLFFYMWADSLLFGAGALGALCLTWYIITRHVVGRKRHLTKRKRRNKIWNQTTKR